MLKMRKKPASGSSPALNIGISEKGCAAIAARLSRLRSLLED
jgi:hypothetical protein